MSKALTQWPRVRFMDANGNPLAGGKIHTYLTGTSSTPKKTYSDSTGTENTNPVILDAEGYADIWLDGDYAYRFRLENALGTLQWQRDGIGAAAGSRVDTMAGLRASTGTANGETIQMLGYYAIGDGPGGLYRWDSSSTATDNGGTIIKATATATGRWMLIHDGTVDVLQFGAKADGTNDSVYINNAAASGVARIVISSTHYLTSVITVPSDTTIEFLSGGAIDYDGTGNVFYIAGSLGTLYALASDVAKGATSFTVTAGNGSNFAAGNSVWIQSEADALSYVGHKKAELVTVLSVLSDTITINGVFADSYTVATTAQAGVATMKENIRYINPMITNRKWASAKTTATSSFIRADFVRNLSITGGVLAKNNAAAFVTINCVDVKMHGVTARDLRDDAGNIILGYGVEAGGATQSMQITGCTFEKCRHGVTTGTANIGPTPNYGVQRGITISGCTAIDCTSASFDTHEDSDGVTFTGNTVIRGGIVGIATRSYRTTITGNTITGVAGNGIYCDNSSLDTTITGNTISNCRKTDETVNGRGHGVFTTGAQTLVSGNLITDCDNFGVYVGNTGATGRDVMVTNNTIISNGKNRSTAWVDVYLAPCTAGVYINSNANRIEVVGNHISDGQAVKTQLYGIWAGVIIGTGEGVVVANNTCSGNKTGPWLNESGKTLINFHGNNPYTMPGHTRRVDTSTGVIATTTEASVSVLFGVTLGNSNYDIAHVVYGDNLEIRNVSAVGAAGYTAKVYNRDGVSVRTGTIRTSITTRE
jgi:parallel beta-helix repeat protein